MFDQRDLNQAEDFIGMTDNENCIYQEYFSYNAHLLEVETPQNWRSALITYERLLAEAQPNHS